MKPDRVVVGCEDVRTGELMKELYSPFVRTGKPILIMDVPSAEMTKYVANAMLATKISFMNDMANLCEKLGVDVAQVRQGIGSDSRIGYPFIFPGPGYGGSCFPKDVQAIIKIAENQGYKLEIMSAVEAVNNRQKRLLFEKLKKRFGNDLKNKTIAVWGLSFKPNTDDMREAPSIVLIENLIAEGAKIKAYDPEATQKRARFSRTRLFTLTKLTKLSKEPMLW